MSYCCVMSIFVGTAPFFKIPLWVAMEYHAMLYNNKRTNGPVNAHLISWPSKAQNIQNLEKKWQRNDHDLQYSHTFINSISCMHLPTFRSLAAIVWFPIEKPKLPKMTLP